MATLRITQVKSANGSSRKQRESLKTLGLGKIGRSAEHKDSPELRGMLRHINHLVRIEGRDA